MMPVLDGYGVLHLLNKHVETYGILFIFLTAKSEKADLRKGLEMGADDYLTKPFDGIELLNAIDIRLKKAALIKQHAAKSNEDVSVFKKDVNKAANIKLTSGERELYDYKKSSCYTLRGSGLKLCIT